MTDREKLEAIKAAFKRAEVHENEVPTVRASAFDTLMDRLDLVLVSDVDWRFS